MQMCLLCPEVTLDGFRHEQLEETAEIKRLERARRVAISHAYSQALTTFQVLSPPPCVNCVLLTTYAEHGRLSSVVRGFNT